MRAMRGIQRNLLHFCVSLSLLPVQRKTPPRVEMASQAEPGARLLSQASASAHQKHARPVRASLDAWVCAQSTFPSDLLLKVLAGPGPLQSAVSFLVLFTRSPRLSPPIPVEVLGTYLPGIPPTPTP